MPRSVRGAICAGCIARISRFTVTANQPSRRPRPRRPERRKKRSRRPHMPVIDVTTTAPCKRLHADPRAVLTGTHFINGDAAACEGALAAGARFAAGYPITPSTEIVERFAARAPQVGGLFLHLGDELAASIAIQGAVWGGAKAFTVT